MKVVPGLVVSSLSLTVSTASPFGCSGGEYDLLGYSDGSLKSTSVLAYDFRNCMNDLQLTIDQIKITTPGLVMNCLEVGSGFDHFQFSVNRGNPFYLDIKIWVTWTKDKSILIEDNVKCADSKN